MRHLLTEDTDYLLPDGGPIVITSKGVATILAHHLRGNSVAIDVDECEVLIVPTAEEMNTDIDAALCKLARDIGSVE